MKKEDIEDLRELVKQYNERKLPGQPRFRHAGTSLLVNRLWDEVLRLLGLEEKKKEGGER